MATCSLRVCSLSHTCKIQAIWSELHPLNREQRVLRLTSESVNGHAGAFISGIKIHESALDIIRHYSNELMLQHACLNLL